MRRLLAVCAAGMLCFAVFGCYVLSWPPEEGLWQSFAEKPYWVSATRDISKSPHAQAAAIEARINEGDNVHVLLGSSELSLVDPLSSHPFHFFNEHNYALDTISIGSGGFQSLFHAIEVAALDELDSIPDRKVALIVSMQWFPNGGCEPAAFQESFSWESFELLAGNGKVSEETLNAIIFRASELGVEEADLRAVAGIGTPAEMLNYAVGRFLSESQRRSGLKASLENCYDSTLKANAPEDESPDWLKWMECEIEEAAEDSTSNDWGVYDAYWDKYTKPWLEEYDSSKYAEPYSDWETAELGDFELFLAVCKEVDVEPLVVIAPVKGWYYDMCGYPVESRQEYYNMVRTTCTDFGVQYVDFSGHDYDLYFLHDVMHMGCVGWVYVNHALMDFFLEEGADGVLPDRSSASLSGSLL